MRYSADALRTFITTVLTEHSVDATSAERVADGLVHASLRGVDSHGIRLLPHYLDELKTERVTGTPAYEFERPGDSVGILDADHAFGHAAGMEATERVKDIATETGAGVVAVKGSNHFGACSYYSIDMAEDGLIGISMTHSDALVVPTGGIQAFLGNNPLSIAAPCSEEGPVCLDMATSKITFNEVLKRREEEKKLPSNSGVDADGTETGDPHEVENLLPVGGYKGYGLGLMIEILCSVLTDLNYGPHLTKMYDDPLEEQRNLGHFFWAIDVERFDELGAFESRVQRLIDEIRSEPTQDGEMIQVPGDPEKETATQRRADGIPLRKTDIENSEEIASDNGLSMPESL